MGRNKIEKFRRVLIAQKRIGLDSMIFIYQFADHPKFGPLTQAVFDLLEKGKIQAVTSTITILEVFIQPEKEKNQFIISEYEKVFQNLPNLEIVDVNWYLARLASKIRALHANVRAPDALQLSAPLLKGYTAFLTNDEKLKQVNLLKVIMLRDYL